MKLSSSKALPDETVEWNPVNYIPLNQTRLKGKSVLQANGKLATFSKYLIRWQIENWTVINTNNQL